MYCAYVTTIKELRKHSNADRLQVATVFGNDVIVGLDCQVGDRVVYFPTDGQLSEEFANDNDLVRRKDENGNQCGGYLDPAKRNIKALKLRGEKSDGLILPIDVLSKYTDVDKLKDGDQISVLDGHEICKKYIPRTNRRRNGGAKKAVNKAEEREQISYPMFMLHADTEQLAYNQSAFKVGDICCITLKCHGTSQRTANTIQITKKKRPHLIKKLFHIDDKTTKKYEVISGTRRVTLRNYDGGFYGDNKFRQKWHDFFKDKLPKGLEVFYEVVGYVEGDKPIMARCKNSLIKDKEFSKMYGDETVFSYGCNIGENDAYIYRMTMTNEDGYVVEIPWHEVQIIAERMGAKCVPTFETFIFTTWEDLMERVEKYYDGTDPIGKTHIREGVVVRILNRESFKAYKHKNWNFKCLESIVKDTSDAPDMEEAQELLMEESNDSE